MSSVPLFLTVQYSLNADGSPCYDRWRLWIPISGLVGLGGDGGAPAATGTGRPLHRCAVPIVVRYPPDYPFTPYQIEGDPTDPLHALAISTHNDHADKSSWNPVLTIRHFVVDFFSALAAGQITIPSADDSPPVSHETVCAIVGSTFSTAGLPTDSWSTLTPESATEILGAQAVPPHFGFFTVRVVVIADLSPPLSFYVRNSWNVSYLKRLIGAVEGVPEDNQRLIFGPHRDLGNVKSLADYGIGEGALIYLTFPRPVFAKTIDGLLGAADVAAQAALTSSPEGLAELEARAATTAAILPLSTDEDAKSAFNTAAGGGAGGTGPS